MKTIEHIEVLSAYSHIGSVLETKTYGNGHINDTILVRTEEKRYILQRINGVAFKRPGDVMENICRVTEHIRGKASAQGLDPERATLTVVLTDAGENHYVDSRGSYWRMLLFVEGTVCRDKVGGREDFSACAEAFGEFQYLLSDLGAEELHETIADFHNTPVRFQRLLSAIAEDKCGRAGEVRSEIEFALSRKDLCGKLEAARERGELPLRVTHNDTKLNNVLFDKENGRAVCVIDLDTVMAGYSVNDFGDAIRYGANTAAEDETDLSLVSLDLELFEAYTEGFLRGCRGALTESEISLLPIGAMMMTFECGIRFLTDYLEGDNYFKIHRERHNLDRARNQFALLADMESKLDKMNAIVKRYNNA